MAESWDPLASDANLLALVNANTSIAQACKAIAIAQGQAANYSWQDVARIVIAGAGPTMFPVGTVLTTTKDNYSYPWAVMHHGIDTDGEPYMDSRVIKAIDNLQFDGQEAFYYCETELAAGTYYITVKTAWSKGCVVGATWNFTLTQAVPAGGQLVGFYDMPDNAADYTGYTVASYVSNTSATAIETVAVTAGTAGNALCDFQGTATTNTNVNSLYRLALGSANYAQSAARQELNSSAAAGSVWKPQTKFDRPPSWATTQSGFMSRLPDDFLAVVSPTSITLDTNNVFETDYTINSSYTIKDKFYLPTRFQIFGTVESHDFSETQWDYYKGATDAERIMYDTSGAARAQWLSSPYVGVAGYVRLVNTTGALGYGHAVYTFAVAPACRIRSLKRA